MPTVDIYPTPTWKDLSDSREVPIWPVVRVRGFTVLLALEIRRRSYRDRRVRGGKNGEFNETLFADVGSVKDADGKKWNYMVMVDEGVCR